MTDIQKFDIIETANPVLTVAPIEEETEMLGATDKITALYCRLSVEDMKEGKNGEKADESNSIQTQDEICQGVFLQKLQFVQQKYANKLFRAVLKSENCSNFSFILYNTALGRSTARSICHLCRQRAKRESLAE